MLQNSMITSESYMHCLKVGAW